MCEREAPHAVHIALHMSRERVASLAGLDSELKHKRDLMQVWDWAWTSLLNWVEGIPLASDNIRYKQGGIIFSTTL
jgi:hypothetical protein